MKLVHYCLLAALFVGAACQNPQKHDEKMAEQKADEATQSAQASAMHEAASDANAANAAVAAVQSAINAAMSKIPMPEFKKNNAKMLAEDFHKYLSELVNANSGKKAGEYMDKLNSLRDEYNKKVAAEKIDAEDKAKLEKYYNDMINAVQTAAP
ncbi:hypothetical protein DVR12_18020 [Chitinophaga silvatica]|uniref:Uncharacterized protein n=1 Tax=Chitinophaga silvatica TaxID=2282649 RepID=A0A3E1Y6E8_9BACT|nr:hypothetical protein [Chitinophaga silvatica]RFS20468.1 hypothetical protein DVR12_18020 [Chitinophaga silvatica]